MLVTRVLLEGGRAVGVEYLHKGEVSRVMAEEVVQVLGVQLLEVLLEGVLVQMATAEYSWSPKYLHHLHRLLLFPAFQDGLLPIVKKSARRKSPDIRDLVLGLELESLKV